MSKLLEKYITRTAGLPPQINEPPSDRLGMVIVIPALAEPQLIQTLDDLVNCDPPECSVEVIVIINHSENAPQWVKSANYESRHQLEQLKRDNSSQWLVVHCPPVYELPRSRAGVGLARKIGMDEALRRAIQAGRADIPIVGYDADCLCAANYFTELEHLFSGSPEVEGCSISFSHRLAGLSTDQRKAILDYECHLQCYIGGLRRAGFPFAFQTIGSAMAVRADTYLKVGGMNTRQAGEDFYFLQKVIERQHFVDLDRTSVFPSARISERVPFGTGRAVKEVMDGNEQTTYHPESYVMLKHLVARLSNLLDPDQSAQSYEALPEQIRTFLSESNFDEKLQEIHANTASDYSRLKRFYQWFNAFRVMKFMHYNRDNGYPNLPVAQVYEVVFADP